MAAATLLAIAAPPAAAARRHRPSPPVVINGLSLHARPTTVVPGGATTISGSLTGPTGAVAGELIELQVSATPHRGFRNVAHALTAADGHFRFPHIRVYVTTRFRVADVGMGNRRGPTVRVVVEVPLFPTPGAIAAAARFIQGRAGYRAFAVDDDHGNISGVNLHLRFHSASVVKSMLLVAYLRMLGYQHRSLDSGSQALLYPMIHSSDNGAASAVLGIVGEGALNGVAGAAHMTDYQPAGGLWGLTEVSAADLARFFYNQDALIPRQFDSYARWLLSNIEPSESWGIPAAARPEFQVFFKGGWLPESEGLVNQVGRLERGWTVFSLAVLTTNDPSMGYGEQTIEGVTARLLGH